MFRLEFDLIPLLLEKFLRRDRQFFQRLGYSVALRDVCEIWNLCNQLLYPSVVLFLWVETQANYVT